jgi:hypothetical protein
MKLLIVLMLLFVSGCGDTKSNPTPATPVFEHISSHTITEREYIGGYIGVYDVNVLIDKKMLLMYALYTTRGDGRVFLYEKPDKTTLLADSCVAEHTVFNNVDNPNGTVYINNVPYKAWFLWFQ